MTVIKIYIVGRLIKVRIIKYNLYTFQSGFGDYFLRGGLRASVFLLVTGLRNSGAVGKRELKNILQ